jgi:hypothetical protein
MKIITVMMMLIGVSGRRIIITINFDFFSVRRDLKF